MFRGMLFLFRNGKRVAYITELEAKILLRKVISSDVCLAYL